MVVLGCPSQDFFSSFVPPAALPPPSLCQDSKRKGSGLYPIRAQPRRMGIGRDALLATIGVLSLPLTPLATALSVQSLRAYPLCLRSLGRPHSTPTNMGDLAEPIYMQGF